MPGIVSAAIVLLVLGIVAGLLVSRAGSTGQVASQASAVAASSTMPAIDTTVADATTVTSPTTAPVVNTELMPTATTYTYTSAPPMTIDVAKKYTATIQTPRGDIVIELLPDLAPQTVNSFVFLARQNFYNGLTWHRVLEGFMAQGGDPEGTGMGGPGYTIPAEFTDKILFDQPGIVAMARRADNPDSAGSQFFITTAPATSLNSQYTIFGRVVQGQDIVDGIPLRNPENPTDAATSGETILGVIIAES
ncbi:MAG: peptidylprolyl isomerase [Oscillochloris sp.]|nr:peptidylprolyl isomerase [Oscillochloris sp.]